MIEILFDLGNLMVLIGTVLLIKTAIKDRKVLKGYSLTGSILTFTGVLLFQLGFLFSGYLKSLAMSMIPLIYWFLVTVYLVKLSLRKPGKAGIKI